MSTAPSGRSGLTGTQWLICAIAAIGFAFDIYELLMLPLIARPALQDLLGSNVQPGTALYGYWVGWLFFLPALVGGIFGLLGGYLTDLLGRRRVLTASILIYAFSAFAAGFSTNIYMLLFFRCTTFVGVCIEFVAAVAWLAELFPDPVRREKVLGFTQAFSSVGGLLVTGSYLLAVKFAPNLPAVQLPSFLNFFGGEISPASAHAAWRYTLMSGLLPALPLIVIRPFLPESPAWKQKKEAGTLKRPSLAQIFAPKLRRTTIVTTLMFACSYGAAFGAIQYMPQIVPGIDEIREPAQKLYEERVAAIAAERGVEVGELPPDVVRPIRVQSTRQISQTPVGHVQLSQELGGLFGRFLLAILAVQIVSRRALIRVFQIPGIVVVPVVFAVVALTNLNFLYIGIFLVGVVTVAQFSFWGNYLPRVYPLHLRGTGESFAANIGGRLVGTSFAAVTSNLAPLLPQSLSGETRLAYTAAAVGTFVYVCGFILSFWLPEPPPEELGEE